ncbi:ergothioneine biosynthesis protein EgtB [Pseudomonas japonica]|uniref:ergothioneine biosynthesis protein EgtB n=1 Tax=Pseudomonas japonica TaxID=256466 RepID=UPI0015E3074E|nr:ergothioneine biosynthesis protein EgtB [Pseudomonas japonica]MBA1245184.1 L-histidine N(alpha)-methyltransferase [Pseudomonas japonica]
MSISTKPLATPPCALAGALLERYVAVRQHSERLAVPLTAEDMAAQSMPDASPTKWHLGHTAWFFETFLLTPGLPGYRPFDPAFAYLFNSYYEAVGPRQPRPQRGMLTRPPVEHVLAYRKHVDLHMSTLLATDLSAEQRSMVELGLQHEQQHQELILMDILHLFSLSPLAPAYDPAWPKAPVGRPGRFRAHAGGLVEIGHDGTGFAFDNEGPRHRQWLEPFEISDRLVTNGQWLDFIAAGGYRTPALWLSEGWATVQAQAWEAPAYWRRQPDAREDIAAGWQVMTLRGLQPLDPNTAVTHVSYVEAAAFAEWAGARLPSEAEWEVAATAGLLEQAHEVAWQWTRSPYTAYPGFRAAAGAVGEYNGKFMVNQMVLRGGANITPPGHSRETYRNFFPSSARWAFSGLRLARDSRSPRSLGGARDTLAEVPQPVSEHTEDAGLQADVLTAMRSNPRQLSPKYFYDEAGSRLFEDICNTPEYYPTRAEIDLLQRCAGEIASLLPPGAALVEFGAGASEKIRLLLDAAPHLAAYVPIDICADALQRASNQLREAYPSLKLIPLVDDFTRALRLPEQIGKCPCVGFFPGSTLGNFTPDEAVAFLRGARRLLGRGASFIVGVDLVKAPEILEAAYDDAAQVTARFNKNLLVRINRELGADFNLDQFRHEARWNSAAQRIEMHLVSTTDQAVTIAGERFMFAAQESLHTENCHKFTPASLAGLAARAGWKVSHQWVSDAPEVALFRLV